MSNKYLTPTERFAWVFLQSLWVGGVWISLLIIFPAIGKTLLSPILVYDVIAQIESKVIATVAVCVSLQLFMFCRVSTYKQLYKTLMGIGMIIVLVLSVTFLTMHHFHLFDYKLRGMLFIVIALLGLFFTFLFPPWLHK